MRWLLLPINVARICQQNFTSTSDNLRVHNLMSSAKRSESSSSKTSASALKVQGGGVEKKKKEDWNDLIPGYDKLTPLEKMKARTQHQLQRVAGKDQALKAGAKNWERFAFNQAAPLNKQDKPDLELEDEQDKLERQNRSAPPQTAEDQNHDAAIFGSAGLDADRPPSPERLRDSRLPIDETAVSEQ